MARINPKSKNVIRTHEGANAKHINAESQLRRSVMACLLWESEFYESGEEIADRISNLIKVVDPPIVSKIAHEARHEMKLRHVPLLIVREMSRLDTHKKYVADTLEGVISRADELAEFLAIYWKERRQPLSAQVKKGLARAFTKFDEYQLAKYNRDGAVKLRDVLFMCHARPKNKEQEEIWKRLIENNLRTPDTWEVRLSSGKDKKQSWENLLSENKLGGLALLRNLRNMLKVNVPISTIRNAITDMKTDRILPFRFISAAKHAPMLEPELECAMMKSIEKQDKLVGETIILLDVSGSMDIRLSEKSDLTRIDSASALAILLREICEKLRVFTFSNKIVEVGARRGFALSDAIRESQFHGATYLGEAISHIRRVAYDRLIVITDEQSHDRVPDPIIGLNYMINIASNKNGVGYGSWTHIDGWSESIVKYIQTIEHKLQHG